MFGEMSDQTVYIACSLTDSSDKFTVEAESYVLAQVELLDKLGYVVVTNNIGTIRCAYLLADIDDMTDYKPLKSTTIDNALNEALTIAKWKILDPMELVGGRMGGGFSIEVRPE